MRCPVPLPRDAGSAEALQKRIQDCTANFNGFRQAFSQRLEALTDSVRLLEKVCCLQDPAPSRLPSHWQTVGEGT